MSVFELIFQPITYFFLIPTIILLLVLINSFVSTNPSLSTIFETPCASTVSQPLFSDYATNTGTIFFQYTFPANFNSPLEYSEKAFEVMGSLFDSANNIKSTISDSQIKISRKNYALLKQCSDKTCLCIADTNIPNFNFSNFDLTACFNLLYEDDAAREAFNNYIRSNSGDDLALFRSAVNAGLATLSAVHPAKECYNYINGKKSNFDSKKSPNTDNEFFYFKSLPETNLQIYEMLSEFFLKTQASLMFDIIDCSVIPNENYCTYTQSIKGNYIVFEPQANTPYIFIGLNPGTKASLFARVDENRHLVYLSDN
jgi:hypothetical protein